MIVEIRSFEEEYKDYESKIDSILDIKIKNLMLHAFCMGYLQLSSERK